MCLIWSLFYMLHWWYVLKKISVTFNIFLRFKTVSKTNLQIILNTVRISIVGLGSSLSKERWSAGRRSFGERDWQGSFLLRWPCSVGWQEVQIQSHALAPNLKMGSGLSRFNVSGSPLGKVTGRWGVHEPRLRQRQGHRAGFERRSVWTGRILTLLIIVVFIVDVIVAVVV